MIEQLSQYGVAVVILILVLREVLPWAASIVNGKNGRVKSSDSVTRAEFDQHKKVVQYRDNCEQIQITINTRFDGLEKLTNQRFGSIETGLNEVKSLIKNGGNS